jgi:hypothetical protein
MCVNTLQEEGPVVFAKNGYTSMFQDRIKKVSSKFFQLMMIVYQDSFHYISRLGGIKTHTMISKAVDKRAPELNETGVR